MFRVITDYVNTPTLFMMCDIHSCGLYAAVIIGGSPDLETQQQSFIASRNVEGWAIGLDRQLCPGHAREIAEQIKELRDRRIIVPGSQFTGKG